MKQNELHPDIADFVSSLTRLENILSEYEAVFWAGKISRVKKIAEKSDGYSVEMFLSFFGGMGSLNDLILTAPASVNVQLREELSRAFSLAKKLN